MNVNIPFTGHTADGSDYGAQDGALAVSMNLLNADGSLRPVKEPKVVNEAFEPHQEYLYIHKTSGFTHYIVFDNNEIGWFDEKEPKETHSLRGITRSGIVQITSLGNTLLIVTSSQVHYYLWKPDDKIYLSLGSHIPEMPLLFALSGHYTESGEIRLKFDDENQEIFDLDYSKPTVLTLSESNKFSATRQVLGEVNKFIAETSVNAGKFIFPFFVRYALRLYDGTLTMHSSPVLMIASSRVQPEAYFTRFYNHDDKPEWQPDWFCAGPVRLSAIISTLEFSVCGPDPTEYIERLQHWKDIVKSVDIFISKPIYTYDQNGECESIEYAENVEGRQGPSDSFTVCKLDNQNASTTAYPPSYQKIYLHEARNLNYNFVQQWQSGNNLSANLRLTIPAVSQEEVQEKIKSESIFYLLKSYNIDDLPKELTAIEIPTDYLQSLTSREVMTDDYDSHDEIVPGSVFPYNQRLNVAQVRKRLYSQFSPAAFFTHSGKYYHLGQKAVTNVTKLVKHQFYVHIMQDGKELILPSLFDSTTEFNAYDKAPFLYFLYPNSNAFKLTIVGDDLSVREVPLQPHPTLNGAYYFSGWTNPRDGGDKPIGVLPVSWVDLPNKIYQTEINNPFYYPLSGRATIGVGQIKGLCAAARPLSQGQFGQFPLYAFTDEGVWALEVSANGTYSARQPITRDVCVDAGSITQLDSSVLFATDRGIMEISGAQTSCITDTIATEFPLDMDTLPLMGSILSRFNQDVLTKGGLIVPAVNLAPFSEFLKEVKMTYDYSGQRIIIFNPNLDYAYVFSLKTKLWGMMASKLKSVLNSYPDAYAVDADGQMVDLSTHRAGGTPMAGVIITRPLTLSAPDIHKTIDNVITRGHFERGHVQSVLYGSRDLNRWHLVWSSKDHYLRGFRGTPYKYFRLALLCWLDDGETLNGASIQFNTRLTDQPR